MPGFPTADSRGGAVEKGIEDFLRLELPGSKLVVGDGVTGVLSEDLRTAALAAVELDPAACREHALLDTWEAATHQILDQLAPCRSD